MLIFICNYISIFFWKTVLKKRKHLIAMISLQMFLILALRDLSMGSDLVNYSGGFQFISSLSFSDLFKRLHLIKTAELVSPFAYESGYVVINKIVASLGGNFRFFLILHAAFCMWSFAHFINKYSALPYLSFAMLATLGFYEYSFGILRQTLALCILLWSIPYIQKRKPIKFLIIVFIAFTVHRAALIFIILYPIARLKITRKTFKVSFFLWLLMLILVVPIFNNIIVPILKLIGKTTYLEGTLKFNSQIVIMIMLAILIYLFVDFKELNENKSSKIICYGYLLSIPIEIVGLMNDGIARMVEILFIFAIVLIPNILYSYKQKDATLSYLGQGALYTLLLVFMIITLSSSEIVPYLPFWKGGTL